MEPVEVAIIAVSDEVISVSIDYHRREAPAIKRWAADRPVVEAICDDLEEVLLEAAEMTFTDTERAERRKHTEERLTSLGLSLFQEIMKEEGDNIRAQAGAPEEGRCLILKIDKALAYIPFELMNDGSGFLSHSLAIGRIILTEEVYTAPSSGDQLPMKVLIVGDPTDDPAIRDDVEREISAVRDVFSKQKAYSLKIASGRGADRRFILSNMPGAAVFHFTGHGVVSDDPDCTGIGLQGGRVLSGDALRGLQRPPGAVFLNMCTAAPRSAWKGSLGIVETLLRRGVRACVASLWDLRSKTATSMASRFYAYLLRGETFGHALRRARLDTIRDKGLHDPTWAAYALYGDPRLTLLGDPVSARRARRNLHALAVALGIMVFLVASLFPRAVHKERVGTDAVHPVGYLLVESHPEDATALIDGEAGARTPGTIELPVGRHHLVIEKEGYRRWEAWVEVKGSVRTDVHADLVKLKP
jgi:CHAT domain-containing protein